MQRLERCPWCDLALIAPRGKDSFLECPSCRGLLRTTIPTDERLAELYRTSWQDPLEHTRETGGTEMRLARIYSAQLGKSLGAEGFAGKKILDFGAGRGNMMLALSELGADVYGVEPFGWEFLERHRLKVFRELAELSPDVRVDGIVTVDVIEHLSRPWITLAQLRGFLKPHGWIFIATPNLDGFRARVLRARYTEALKSVHLALYTPAALERLLIKCGFAEFRRLKWFVSYGREPLHRLLHRVVQAAGLDGELRYVAWRD